MPDYTAAIALLKKPIESVVSSASGRLAEKIKQLRTERSVRQAHQKLIALQKVKTIWNIDRPVALRSFYYPSALVIGNVRQEVDSFDDVPDNHVVFTGTAGQGKSIFLRWLIDKEIKSGTRLPLFIELRRIQKGKFSDYLTRAFCDLFDSHKDEDLFRHFASNGKISFLLDAFDEIDPELITEAVDEIERLAQSFPLCRIAVTSRPNSALHNSAFFSSYSLAPLTHANIGAFVTKILGKDADLSNKLIAAIKASPRVRELISTPLLATLLTIVYRAHRIIPLDFVEFYEELFSILLIRHDKSKAGYQRARRAGLVDREVEAVFAAFCFRGRVLGKNTLKRTEAFSLAKEAIVAANVSCKEEAFLDDVIKVTCLLQLDSDRYQFVHQSVQEYFSSVYVCSRPEPQAQKFYSQLLLGTKWKQWGEELRFLQKTDAYRASKYFFIPSLQSLLEKVGANSTEDVLRSYLWTSVAQQKGVIQKTLAVDGTRLTRPTYHVRALSDIDNYFWNVFEQRTFALLFQSQDPPIPWSDAFDKSTQNQLITYADIAIKANARVRLEEVMFGCVNYLRGELEQFTKTVSSADATENLMLL